jgi:hypothetical protein
MKLVQLISGRKSMANGVTASAGASSSGSVPVLGATGLVDVTMLPVAALMPSGTGLVYTASSVPRIATADTDYQAANKNNALTYAASLTVNFATGKMQSVTLAGNAAITLSGGAAGQRYVLSVSQDATGTRVPTWGTTIRWQGGTAPTLTATASKTDLIALIYDGTNWFGQAALNF